MFALCMCVIMGYVYAYICGKYIHICTVCVLCVSCVVECMCLFCGYICIVYVHVHTYMVECVHVCIVCSVCV